jgi:hypothetical protein
LAKSLEQRIQEAIREDVAIVPCDSSWPAMFTAEAEHLRAMLNFISGSENRAFWRHRRSAAGRKASDRYVG